MKRRPSSFLYGRKNPSNDFQERLEVTFCFNAASTISFNRSWREGGNHEVWHNCSISCCFSSFSRRIFLSLPVSFEPWIFSFSPLYPCESPGLFRRSVGKKGKKFFQQTSRVRKGAREASILNTDACFSSYLPPFSFLHLNSTRFSTNKCSGRVWG